ncbi:MAG: hypothetical protein ACOYJV_00165 [Aminivibrio sp.]
MDAVLAFEAERAARVNELQRQIDRVDVALEMAEHFRTGGEALRWIWGDEPVPGEEIP